MEIKIDLNDTNVLRREYLRSLREIEYMEPLFFETLQQHYNEVEKNIKKKFDEAAKIGKDFKFKVGFIVMYDDIFPAEPIFLKMCNNKLFEPEIIVINLYGGATINYSQQKISENYEKSYRALYDRYGNKVKRGYEPEIDKYIDLVDDKYDFIISTEAYYHLCHPYFLPSHFFKTDTLHILIHYGIFMTQNILKTVSTVLYSSFWKVYVENSLILEAIKERAVLKGRNVYAAGYPRMDALEDIHIDKSDRLCIMIAPHHGSIPNAVEGKPANIVKYADFFLTLPERYPNIDFIFRPHPYTIDALKSFFNWKDEDVESYISKLKSYPNVIYSEHENHLKHFVKSDAIIHDCGSFLIEYLYTKKPCCYFFWEKDYLDHCDKYFNVQGQAALEHYYHAVSEEDIIDFIDKIVINKNDYKKNSREKFADEYLLFNHPNVSQKIIDDILSSLKLEF